MIVEEALAHGCAVTVNNGGDRLIFSRYGTRFGWVDLPAKWAICRRCEGCGTDRGASVECDGGGFAASEWAEQDEDFREGYLRGDYDKPCDVCSGSGKVLVIDRARCTRKQIADHDSYQREEADYRRLCAMERRMET